MKIPHWKRDAHAHFWKNLLLTLFLSDILSHLCQLLQTTSDPAQSWKIRPKLRFSCFSGKQFGTILSCRSRLSRTSRAPSRLRRPRPIGCDGGPKQTVQIFLFWGVKIVKKRFSKSPLSSCDLHPKRSSQPDFRDRGGSIRARNAGKKSILGRPACMNYNTALQIHKQANRTH